MRQADILLKSRIYTSIGILLLWIQSAYGADTTSVAVSRFPHSPRSVMLRSAVLPGWGQWTNHKPLKTAIVVIGEGILIWRAVDLNQDAAAIRDDEDLKLSYEDARSDAVWGAAALYLLNLMDAYIDAHLFDFDTGPDLSFHPQPVRGAGFRLTCSISLNGD